MVNILRIVALAVCLGTAAQAQEKTLPSMWVGDLLIHAPVLRVTPAGAPVAGGYLAVENTGDTQEVLLSARADISPDVQLHEMVMSGDVMKMRAIDGGITVPAGETVRLMPGGYHLMLMKPSTALVAGETHDVSLEFLNAGSVTLPFTVAPLDVIRDLGKDAHGHGN